jgi:acetyl-CoA C-acetyltransferase
MTDLPGADVIGSLAMAADQEWEAFHGITFPGLYALVARRYMYEFKATPEQFAMVSVKNHNNGSLNPHAQFKFKISVETVLKSPLVSDPLRLLDCSPITDGSAAIILATEDVAKKVSEEPIWLVGSGHATDSIALHDRDSITTFNATVNAAKQAYKQANLKPSQIDFVEVHDCFTIAEILAIEDLGFFMKGTGAQAVESGLTSLDAEIPVNPSGGLKAKGHPVGATGIAQVVEIITQLQGKAGKRQIEDANIGMTHNVGGSGGTALVHIFRRD